MEKELEQEKKLRVQELKKHLNALIVETVKPCNTQVIVTALEPSYNNPIELPNEDYIEDNANYGLGYSDCLYDKYGLIHFGKSPNAPDGLFTTANANGKIFDEKLRSLGIRKPGEVAKICNQRSIDKMLKSIKEMPLVRSKNSAGTEKSFSFNSANHIKGFPFTQTLHNATYEAHIFLAPVFVDNNISEESKRIIISNYESAVNIFNNHYAKQFNNKDGTATMKAPILTLSFSDGRDVTILQSSIYLTTNCIVSAVSITMQLAEYFRTWKFTVLREKLEVTVPGTDGLPMTDAEASKYKGYYEFHIRIENKDSPSELNNAQIQKLKDISELFTELFQIPVPLSYNNKKQEQGDYSKYLNLRFETGYNHAIYVVNLLKELIDKHTNMKVEKTIEEYVIYDTYRSMDAGWIDFEKKQTLFDMIKSNNVTFEQLDEIFMKKTGYNFNTVFMCMLILYLTRTMYSNIF